MNAQWVPVTMSISTAIISPSTIFFSFSIFVSLISFSSTPSFSFYSSFLAWTSTAFTFVIRTTSFTTGSLWAS
jgi:hypothetical protein